MKILAAIILLPFFLLGTACNAMWNGFMFGWYCFGDDIKRIDMLIELAIKSQQPETAKGEL
jgi:hypothetical protein